MLATSLFLGLTPYGLWHFLFLCRFVVLGFCFTLFTGYLLVIRFLLQPVSQSVSNNHKINPTNLGLCLVSSLCFVFLLLCGFLFGRRFAFLTSYLVIGCLLVIT